MTRSHPVLEDLSPELRALVKDSVALLGDVIRYELGGESYERIERIRRAMAGLRGVSSTQAHRVLHRELQSLRRLSRGERLGIARAFTLMLELMNSCENAYRAFRLRESSFPEVPSASLREHRAPETIIYVVTAHPTEARSPENIEVFRDLQDTLIQALRLGFDSQSERLRGLLAVAWRVSITRDRKPTVADEAEFIYSLVLRDEVLSDLLDFGAHRVPTYLRSWVGGDKDGHPGVDARAMLQSLTLSRVRLVAFGRERIRHLIHTLELVGAPERKALIRLAQELKRDLTGLQKIRTGDAGRVDRVRKRCEVLTREYREVFGASHPALARIRQLLHVFPGLVVPLELRESSEVLMQAGKTRKELAIEKMMTQLGLISRDGDPRWYARGLIISMASKLEHMQAGCRLVRSRFGAVRIPVVPLFEERDSLLRSGEIVESILSDRAIMRALRSIWNGQLEVMVGYSDSAKESGVLASRVEIARALDQIDRVCARFDVKPVFFHGSGGSVDRGGGSIQDQTAWWPESSRKIYKSTVQGEMIERSFASPEIARRQLERIVQSLSERAPDRRGHSVPSEDRESVRAFAREVARRYQSQVQDPDFLQLVEQATPLKFLSVLKIGSRPAKRAATLSLSSLRAIPWVMCWTQTRVLFPTWWGAGSAWRAADSKTKSALRRAFDRDPLFRSYIKALGFTLAKVELPIWRLYLENSRIGQIAAQEIASGFETELRATLQFVQEVTGEKELLWFRPWLGTSIRLRSPMIHPLNLLQIIAIDEGDLSLLRVTVTGVASGMLTTG